MKFSALIFALVAGSAAAFMPMPRTMALKAAPANAALKGGGEKEAALMNAAMDKFKADYPGFAAKGWGPSVKAERWNGRHAMFGWAMIIGTAQAQALGYIPDPTATLDLSVWGGLAQVGGGATISAERAVIMAANMHAFAVGICATFAPLDYMDTLLLEDGEEDEAPAGLMPKFVPGLTPEAEIMNGRMAMMGLIQLVGYSLITSTPILDVVNSWQHVGYGV